MSRFANVGFLPPSLRAQAEEKLRAGAVVRTHSHDLIEREYIPKPHKFKAKKCRFMGIDFPSLKEADRYRDLVLLERAGEITELQHHVAYPLSVNGQEIATYIADFTYRDAAGRLVVEDVKGYRRGTAYRVFTIKKALMLALHRIRVVEV